MSDNEAFMAYMNKASHDDEDDDWSQKIRDQIKHSN